MNDKTTGKTVGGVEEIILELHERGVKSGKEESERILAEARLKAGDIVKAAQAEQDRIVGEGKREASRITEAARVEAEQLLEAFMASLPEMFETRASRLLESILDTAFDPERGSATIDRFVAFMDDDMARKLRSFFATAEPQSFLEGLMVMSAAFYADAAGIDRFTLDSNLKKTWARLMGDPATDAGIGFEFRDGIRGFAISAKDGREVSVSPESVKHMAEAWAGEEFRDIYAQLAPKPAETAAD